MKDARLCTELIEIIILRQFKCGEIKRYGQSSECGEIKRYGQSRKCRSTIGCEWRKRGRERERERQIDRREERDKERIYKERETKRGRAKERGR